MKVETQIKLNKFVPRHYQLPICDALEVKKYKRILAILPRRAGKDVCAFNLMIRQAFRKVGVYFYIFPTYSQAKKVIWDSITNTGQKFLDYIPSELIQTKNSQEMKITLINQSIIQLVGSDNIDSLVGTNPQGCVFSEYALQSSEAYQFLRPILLANDGWALFISTPRGKNHMWELYQIALNNPKDWFCLKLTVNDTQHIPLHDIERERAEGLMSDDLIEQEYFTSFELGVEGSIYAKNIDKMRLRGQIGQVPWESAFKVNTSWDIGRDTTAIIFFQCVGQIVRIIDYYEKAGENLEFFVNMINSKPYTYGKHFFPHDMRVTEWAGPKFTRIEKARQLGIKATVVDDVGLEDGIEYVRSSFSKIWIDDKNCKQLLNCLENYRREYDTARRTYKPNPLHNWASHGADSMRYLCISLPKTRDGLSPEVLEQRYQEAMAGPQGNLPRMFRTDDGWE